MEEKEIVENLLLCVKGECDLMMHGAIESSTPEVHAAFTRAMNETVAMQSEIYNCMAKKGWYPSTSAEKKQIDAVKQKFSGGC